jgi:DNA-directed RNA polymerase subunit RPC12/RpoP
METDTTALRCESCGMLVERLMTARSTVRSLSLGREIKVGEPICERCMQELQEELTEEEALRGPA